MSGFSAIVLGGTGQVGGAAVAELLALPECREVVLVTRRRAEAPARRVRYAVLDSAAEGFTGAVGELATSMMRQGRVSAVSCAGVGSGSAKWSEEDLLRLEVGVGGGFARGCQEAGIGQYCLLSAVGSSARSRMRYPRVMGMKEDMVRGLGFPRLAIFRPGIIAGNAHTPGWVALLGGVIPGPYGNIDQRVLGRAIAAEVALHGGDTGVVVRENAAMRALAGELAG